MTELPQAAVELLYPVLFIISVTVVAVLAILGTGWAGFRWLRSQIREEQRSDDHRKLIREELGNALETERGRRALDAAVERGTSAFAEKQNRAIQDIDRKVGSFEARLAAHDQRLDEMKTEAGRSATSQGERLSRLETWQAGAEVLLQTVAEHGRKLNALERLVLKLYEILKRLKLIASEETGT